MKLIQTIIFSILTIITFTAHAGIEEITGTLKEVRLQLNSEITGAAQGVLIEMQSGDKNYSFGINTNHKMWAEFLNFAQRASVNQTPVKARFEYITLPDGTHGVSLRSISIINGGGLLRQNPSSLENLQ